MCEGASKQSPDLKNYTTPGPPPGSKIPGSATGLSPNIFAKIDII